MCIVPVNNVIIAVKMTCQSAKSENAYLCASTLVQKIRFQNVSFTDKRKCFFDMKLTELKAWG